MSDEKNCSGAEQTENATGNRSPSPIAMIPLSIKWISRIVTVVFLCSLLALFKTTQYGVVIFIDGVLPYSFLILFLSQMAYYFSWHCFERENKSKASDSLVDCYGKLKGELKISSFFHGFIFLALYLTKAALI
jgi:hypothetical protein